MRTATLLLVILLATAPRAEALEHWFTYALGYGTLSGDDFEGFDPGPTMGIRYSARVWSNLYAGIGGDLSRYDFETSSDRQWQTDAMATLRWYVPVGSWRLFVDGFGGYSQYSFRTISGKVTGRGLMWGAALGAAIPVKGAFLDVSIDANQQNYQDAEVGNVTVEDSDFSGQRALLRLGLRIPLGG